MLYIKLESVQAAQPADTAYNYKYTLKTQDSHNCTDKYFGQHHKRKTENNS